MRVILDIDGVLAEFDASAAATIELLYPDVRIDRSPPWPREWEWLRTVLGPEREKEFWDQLIQNPEWWARMPLTDDAVPLVADGRLLELYRQHDCYAVTNRHPSLREASEFWLYSMTGVPIPVIAVPGPKGPLAAALRADLLIDDKPEHCESALEHGVEARLIARPWNEGAALERISLESAIAPILALQEEVR